MQEPRSRASSDDLVLVLGSDDRYSFPLAITLFSALRHVDPAVKVRVWIIDGGITDAHKSRIEHVAAKAHPSVDIRWTQPDMARFGGLRTTHWGSPASYMTLLIPGLLANEPHALYLDSDLLVHTDVLDLWELRQSAASAPVHAVVDYGFWRLGDALKGDGAVELGLDPAAPYFNSGVMVIDLDRWRQDRIPERALAFARDHPDVMRFTDQDALNVILEGDWKQLDPRWNVLVGSIDRYIEQIDGTDTDRDDQRRLLTESPHIMHFSGKLKPWKPGYRRLGRAAYRRAVKESAWFETSGQYRSWSMRLALLDPWVRLKQTAIRLLWPVVERLRDSKRSEPDEI